MKCDNKLNIEFYKNKTKTWEIIFTKNTAVVDITDYTIYFIAKTKKADTDANAILALTITSHTDATNGKTEIHLTKAQTNLFDIGTYWYSVEYNDGEAGADEDEAPLYEGKLTVSRPTRIGT